MGKAVKALAICAAIMGVFTGCQGTRLADRTIIRGILLDQGEAGGWAITLCWDAMEEQATVQWAQGQGDTLEEALFQAQNQLPGEAFYGQTQQVLVSGQLTYEQLQQAGTLFVSPQMALPLVQLALVEQPLEEKEPGEWLSQVETMTREYGLSADLYETARRRDCVVLPVVGKQGLGCRIVYADGSVLQWSGGEAQLALMMAGLGQQLSLEWPDGAQLAQVTGEGSALFGWKESAVEVTLRLRSLRLLDKSAPDKPQEKRFQDWVRTTGEAILDQAGGHEGDPFQLLPWVKNYSFSLGQLLEMQDRQPPVKVKVEIRFSP